MRNIILTVTDWLWAHIVFPLVTTPDPKCPYGGGITRDNRVCRFIADAWLKIG